MHAGELGGPVTCQVARDLDDLVDGTQCPGDVTQIGPDFCHECQDPSKVRCVGCRVDRCQVAPDDDLLFHDCQWFWVRPVYQESGKVGQRGGQRLAVGGLVRGGQPSKDPRPFLRRSYRLILPVYASQVRAEVDERLSEDRFVDRVLGHQTPPHQHCEFGAGDGVPMSGKACQPHTQVAERSSELSLVGGGIRGDQPLPDGLELPGVDVDALDMATISRFVVDEHRPLRDAARTLGVHIEHIRLALERLDRPQRQWAINAAPTAWLTEQRAARLFTREFFDREYIGRGRTLREFAAETGIGRPIIARVAKHLGVPLNNGRTPFPIDPDWLREQYCDRLRSTAGIAAELGTDQMIVNNALHRFGIPARPSGVASFPAMITKLGENIPRDIRAAVEGSLHGWYRLHRFQIAMAFPNLHSAADYLGTIQCTLTVQFQRLEHDIGATLYHRGAYNKPHHPTPRGHTLLRDLAQDRIQQLMTAGLREDQILPKPDGKTLIDAQRKTLAPRKPAPLRPFDDITVERLRVTRPLYTLLRHLTDHHAHNEFYGLELLKPTGLGEGTLYPNLKRLEHAGWLTSHLEDEHEWLAGAPHRRGPGRRRTYYTFTPEGRKAAYRELHQREKGKS